MSPLQGTYLVATPKSDRVPMFPFAPSPLPPLCPRWCCFRPGAMQSESSASAMNPSAEKKQQQTAVGRKPRKNLAPEKKKKQPTTGRKKKATAARKD